MHKGAAVPCRHCGRRALIRWSTSTMVAIPSGREPDSYSGGLGSSPGRPTTFLAQGRELWTAPCALSGSRAGPAGGAPASTPRRWPQGTFARRHDVKAASLTVHECAGVRLPLASPQHHPRPMAFGVVATNDDGTRSIRVRGSTRLPSSRPGDDASLLRRTSSVRGRGRQPGSRRLDFWTRSSALQAEETGSIPVPSASTCRVSSSGRAPGFQPGGGGIVARTLLQPNPRGVQQQHAGLQYRRSRCESVRGSQCFASVDSDARPS